MKNKPLYILLLFLFINFISVKKTHAQYHVNWEILYGKWLINSAGYPEDISELDSLYYQISDCTVEFFKGDKFKISWKTENIEGVFKIDKILGQIICITTDQKEIIFHLLELNEDYLVLNSDSALKPYFLSLISSKLIE